MSEFARHVVREEVALTFLVPTALMQIRREKLVRAILGGDVYCHFERRRPQQGLLAWKSPRLACAFSNERKVLLGEVVRDWLAEEHGAESFLWCESIDGALAMALVVDGRVVKDDLNVDNADREVRAALAQLGRERAVFVHRDVSIAAFETVPGASAGRVLDASVRDRVRWLRSRDRPVPELALANSLPAVRRWQAAGLWARRTTVAAVLIAAAAFALNWWWNRSPDAAEVVDVGPTVSEAEYLALLEAPDPATLLPAIHRAYRQLLADPVLGAHWEITNFAWTRQESVLAVGLALPKAGTPGATELDADLKAEIERYTASQGWQVSWEEQGTTVRIPVTAAPPTPERQRMPERSPAANPWHHLRLAEDLAPIGLLRVFNTNVNNTFHSTLSELVLKRADWSSAELANYLGARLGGGPLLLERLILVQNGPWATGELRFRSVYCATTDAAAASCPEGSAT